LPPPSVLKEFDGVINDGAERIMRMAELEQQHRHLSERIELKSNAKNITVGQILGFIISLASMQDVLRQLCTVRTGLFLSHWLAFLSPDRQSFFGQKITQKRV